jgi:hypothetical protein
MGYLEQLADILRGEIFMWKASWKPLLEEATSETYPKIIAKQPFGYNSQINKKIIKKFFGTI